MKSISIPIHSFVDLITNSSSETYVTATKKSVTTLKELVDSLLAGTGKTCDDVLEIKLIPAEDEYSTAQITATAKDPSCEQTAKIINKLASTFETTEIYC